MRTVSALPSVHEAVKCLLNEFLMVLRLVSGNSPRDA